MISILHKNQFPESEYQILNLSSTIINAIQGEVKEPNKTVATVYPIKFNYPEKARMKWIAMNLEKPYDLIIGMDWRAKNVKTISIETEEIFMTSRASLPFLSKIIQEEINVLEVSEVQ